MAEGRFGSGWGQVARGIRGPGPRAGRGHWVWGRGQGGGAWPAPETSGCVAGAWAERCVLPERSGGAAEVQGRQALCAEQVRVGTVLQQQLRTGRVAPQAGLVQGPSAAGTGVGVRTAAEQVVQAVCVAAGRCDAQGRGELALVLQGPEAWGEGKK